MRMTPFCSGKTPRRANLASALLPFGSRPVVRARSSWLHSSPEARGTMKILTTSTIRLAVPLLLGGLAAFGGPVSAQTPYGTPGGATSSNVRAALPTVVSGAGDIALVVGAYRALLGDPNNGGAPVTHETGRREINWDGVPDASAAPNFLPGDFFNATTDPRARGALLATPGTGLQVSANSTN